MDKKAPGFLPRRLVSLAQRIIADIGLDLRDSCVVTEAATGAYGITAIIAALAGAKRVIAVTKASRYGSVEDVQLWMRSLVAEAQIESVLEIRDSTNKVDFSCANIVTNSGFLRPITRKTILSLPNDAVIALMFEAWELRKRDIDVSTCKSRGIPIVGINERHPRIDVFGYLGPLCVFQLQKAGISVYNCRIAMICDNQFDSYIVNFLRSSGATVVSYATTFALEAGDWDAVVICLHMQPEASVSEAALQHIAGNVPPQTIILQFWGQIDREVAKNFHLEIWPLETPSPGHMGVLLSDIGPESIIRLQAGGLRAAQQVLSGEPITTDGFAQLVG